MLLTLPLILFIVMTELSIGAFTVLYLLDWRNQVKRSFLVTYAIIFLILTGLTVLVQQNFSTPELLNTFALLDKAWPGYLPPPLLLFLLLMLPYTILLWLDKKAGGEGREKAKEEGTRRSSLRLLGRLRRCLVLPAWLLTLFVLRL